MVGGYGVMRTAALLLCACFVHAGAETPSAFRFREDAAVKIAIERTEILRGVRGQDDPRDKIPAIREPKALAAAEATFLLEDDRVLGVVVGEEARAYPIRILEQHEMVNDVLGGVPIAPNY